MKELLIALVNRFPRPDFESGYQYPEYSYAVPNEVLWDTLDVVMLLLLLGFVTWALYKKRTRKPIFWTSIVSIAYFGFFRGGCVCSIGSIQNVAYAFVEDSYRLPIVVLLFFLVPIIFAYLFGRVFCAGVCPFGALQDLVNVKNYRLSRAVSGALSIIPWLYLIFALLYALTRTRFIICQFDPFIGIFRLGGDWDLIIFGAILLVMSIFTGRPFCRFLCPYGALLSVFSSVSIWKIRITKKPCITCELCHNSCPVDTIRSPYKKKIEESHRQGVMRVVSYFIVLPLLMVAGAVLMNMGSENLSNAHREVRLYNMVMAHEADPDGELTVEAEAFYSQGRTIEDLTASYQQVQDDFKVYGTMAGTLIGLVVGLKLINLSLKRTRKEYEIDYSNCIACGKCFDYCPQNKIVKTK